MTTVTDYVQAPTTCARMKCSCSQTAGLLHPLPVPPRPWLTMTRDFVTNLPESEVYTVILVVVDAYTNMSHFVPCPQVPMAPQLAHLFSDNIFRLHGLPHMLISNHGSQFTSRFWC